MVRSFVAPMMVRVPNRRKERVPLKLISLWRWVLAAHGEHIPRRKTTAMCAPRSAVPLWVASTSSRSRTANLRAKILDFKGFYSSRISILRGGILMSAGNFPEMLSRRILAGILAVAGMILVGRFGAATPTARDARRSGRPACPCPTWRSSPGRRGLYYIYIYMFMYLLIYIFIEL